MTVSGAVLRGLVLVLAVTLTGAFAATVRGKVDFGGLPNGNLAVRCDASQQAFVRSDGSFTLRDVSPGLHEISVVDSLRWFSKAIVEIDASGKQVTRIIEVLPPQQPNGGPVRKEAKSIVLKPIGMVDYFEKRQQMSVASLFANPMMLMMVVTLGLGMVMPKLMENMDPEELKQMQDQVMQQQKATSDPSKAFANLLGQQTKTNSDSDEE